MRWRALVFFYPAQDEWPTQNDKFLRPLKYSSRHGATRKSGRRVPDDCQTTGTRGQRTGERGRRLRVNIAGRLSVDSLRCPTREIRRWGADGIGWAGGGAFPAVQATSLSLRLNGLCVKSPLFFRPAALLDRRDTPFFYLRDPAFGDGLDPEISSSDRTGLTVQGLGVIQDEVSSGLAGVHPEMAIFRNLCVRFGF